MGKGLLHRVRSESFGMKSLLFSTKVWVHQLERSSHGHVRIELAHLNLMLHGACDEKWVNRSMGFCQDVAEKWDLGDGHYEPGTKGTKAQVKYYLGRDATGVELAEVCLEANVSVVLALLAPLREASPANPKEKTPEQLEQGFLVPAIVSVVG